MGTKLYIESDENVSRVKLRLDTQTDVMNFVSTAVSCPPEMTLHIIDDQGMRINARSLLGVLYAQEFKHMWLVSNDSKIHEIFKEFTRD